MQNLQKEPFTARGAYISFDGKKVAKSTPSASSDIMQRLAECTLPELSCSFTSRTTLLMLCPNRRRPLVAVAAAQGQEEFRVVVLFEGRGAGGGGEALQRTWSPSTTGNPTSYSTIMQRGGGDCRLHGGYICKDLIVLCPSSCRSSCGVLSKLNHSTLK